ncbi:exonuclease mut-7 homolog isoform X4 [Phacochoerus africanus]|uniref:exonuclease mut-7 homolog isoform X4 n=1 Tax=Phacochoerus africanus TaxID=41426 RepID=UPI001FD8998A|nr:exonuclease mut-7 homolog isoform X4 [Phacochoerus africanus]
MPPLVTPLLQTPPLVTPLLQTPPLVTPLLQTPPLVTPLLQTPLLMTLLVTLPVLQEEAWRGFAALADPLAGLLDMLDGSQGWRGRGPSLEAWVARELKRWLQARPHPGPPQGGPGLRQLQARAVKILVESPPALVEPLVSIFQLQDADRSPLLAHVHRLRQEGRVKEAVVLSTKLRLQPHLDVEEMSTPLLLQDKLGLVERYVDGFPGLQRRLLSLLDSWCRPGFDVHVVARRHPQAAWRPDRLSPRVLSRQVLRLRERFGLDPALCPHVVTQQRLASLRYLCYKRLVERSLSQESWVEHVHGLVGQNEWLQEQLLQLLASHDDAAVVAQCALDLSLPEERLPATVVTELSRLRLQGSAAEAPSEGRTDDCYQLPIAREDIRFLASWEDLARHEAELLQPGQVVGVDLEWRPSFGVGGRPQASLMQVAVEGRVFLLDLPQLLSPARGQEPQAFSQLVSRLLADPSITKLGYGMAGDLRSLGASCPALAQAQKQLRGSLDLLQVHKQLRVVDAPAPGVDGAAGPRGLSLLVQQVLGKPLDKTQQLSNWDRRPLGEKQLVYAAADAYCLLEVYWALCREPARFHLSGDLGRSLRPGRSERPPLPQQASAYPQQMLEAEEAAPEVQARAFRVVCDSMLQGLARRLRCLGIDVLVLGTGEDHRRAAEVARQEGRIVLTSGLPYHKLNSCTCPQLQAQLGAGRCLAVDCSLKAQQQAKAVIRHFNVRVTQDDIFSRCQACNCDQYLKVSKDMMKQLVRLSGHREGPGRTGGPRHTQSTRAFTCARDHGPSLRRRRKARRLPKARMPPKARMSWRQAQPQKSPQGPAPMTPLAAGWRRQTYRPTCRPHWAAAPSCSSQGSQQVCCGGRGCGISTAARAAAKSSGRAPTCAESPPTSEKSCKWPLASPSRAKPWARLAAPPEAPSPAEGPGSQE